MPNKSFSLIALFFLVFCGQISSVFPQVTTATISGVVTDNSGGVIPGASVEATNLDTGITRISTTGDEEDISSPICRWEAIKCRLLYPVFKPAFG